jgi:hypothetical protein
VLGGLPFDLLAVRRLAARVPARPPRVVAVGLDPVPDRFRSREVNPPAGGRVELDKGLAGPRHGSYVAGRVGDRHIARAAQWGWRVRGANAAVMLRIVRLHIQQPVADDLCPGPSARGACRQVRIDEERVVVGLRGREVLLSENAPGEALHEAWGRACGVLVHHLAEERISIRDAALQLPGRNLRGRARGASIPGWGAAHDAGRGCGQHGCHGSTRQVDPTHRHSPAVVVAVKVAGVDLTLLGRRGDACLRRQPPRPVGRLLSPWRPW